MQGNLKYLAKHIVHIDFIIVGNKKCQIFNLNVCVLLYLGGHCTAWNINVLYLAVIMITIIERHV